MPGKAPGFEIEVAWEGNICPYCGQEADPNASMCSMCHKQMTTVVLALCKELLYNAGQIKKFTSDKSRKEADTTKEAVQELEIYRILDQFPYKLAKRTIRFRKALETEGVWFSHLVAYRFISHLRSDKRIAPPMLICDPTYQMINKQVFDFLQREKPDQETSEAFNNVYHIPEAEDDARAVIGEMIAALERMKRLKIARPKTQCQRCGKDMSSGKSICSECEKDEALNNRLAISSGMPQPLMHPHESTSSGERPGGGIRRMGE